MKEDQERGEQETAARLKAMEASEGAWIGRLATEPTLRERLIAQFAAMSPAERALPAVLDPAQHGTSEMIAPDRPDSERLVALNPAFYASHGSADGREGGAPYTSLRTSRKTTTTRGGRVDLVLRAAGVRPEIRRSPGEPHLRRRGS
jgi:hypothetical protein